MNSLEHKREPEVAVFIVWRRLDDNYVNATKTRQGQRRMSEAFEVLGIFEDNDWGSARELIIAKRKEFPQPEWVA